VFARGNFLTTFVWKKSYGGGAKAKWFVGLHEYALAYCKKKELLPPLFLPPDPGAGKYYRYRDEKFAERGAYRLQPLATTSNDDRPNLRYAIVAPDLTDVWPAKQWQWSYERFAKAREDGEIVFKKSNGGWSVSYKQYQRMPDGEERRTKPVTIIDGIYTQHGTYESIELFGLSEKFSFPKPEELLRLFLEIFTDPKDLVLDSFVGSGTTAAVAHKMGRRWIAIELGEHAKTHCVPRLQKVVDGEQGGISETVGWNGGGGFRFVKLGGRAFNDDGSLSADVKFKDLAAYLWFLETHTPHATGKWKGPVLGAHEGVVYVLLYNGVLSDIRPESGNVLTTAVWNSVRPLLPKDRRQVIVYGEACRLSPSRLKDLRISFKQIPYQLAMR
jgi:adenine-specific DNA-methyltransferase